MNVLMTNAQLTALQTLVFDNDKPGANGNIVVRQNGENLDVTYARYDGSLVVVWIEPDGQVYEN